MKRMNRGFTLIELMVVIAIIGVLASVAIPAYQDYTGKAQFTEGMTQAASLKQEVTLFYGRNGVCPANSASSGQVGSSIDQTDNYGGTYVARVKVTGSNASCVIRSQFKAAGINAELQNKVVQLTGDFSKPTVTWDCVTNAAAKVASDSCPGGATITF